MKSYSHILYMSFLSFLISVTDLLSVVILVPYLYLKFGSDVSLGYFSRYPSLTQDIDTLMVSAVVLLFCIRVLSGWSFQYKLGRMASEYVASINERILEGHYDVIAERAPSFYVNAISQKVNDFVFGYWKSLYTIFGGMLTICIGAVSVVVWHGIYVSVLALGLLSAYFGFYYYLFKKVLRRNGQIVNARQDFLSDQIINKVKENIFHKLMPEFSQNTEFSAANIELRDRQAINMFLPNTPRIIFDMALGLLVVFLGYSSSKDLGSPLGVEAIIGYVLLLMRLTPLLQAIFVGFAHARSANQSKREIEDILSLGSATFENDYFGKINKLDFKVEFPADWKINNLNKYSSYHNGEIIRIIGDSGTGKSTYVKALCGVYSSERVQTQLNINEAVFDSKVISSLATYLPQTVPLLKGDIATNIFGDRVISNDLYAEMKRLLNYFELGYLTHEEDLTQRGLSLGQIQRVGILRAILSGRNIVIFDEPTSALDPNNSRRFWSLIDKNQDKIIFVISHDENIPISFSQTIKMDKYDV